MNNKEDFNQYGYLKLVEFSEDQGFDKFDINSNATFKDNTSKYSWFCANKKKIHDTIDIYKASKIIWMQFEKFRYYTDLEKEKEKQALFGKRKLEFLNEKDLNKFKFDNHLKFEDGTLKGSWFSRYKVIIQSSSDPVSKQICSQFIQYKKMIKNSLMDRRIEFEKKLEEFCEELNLEKFSSESNICFKDGTLMYQWFFSNIGKIRGGKDKFSKLAMQQHRQNRKNYKANLKDKMEKIFAEKKLEFAKEENLDKFRECSSMKFMDGTYMEPWFMENKKLLLGSTDDLAKKIIEQYEKYTNSYPEEMRSKRRFFVDGDTLENTKSI